MNEQVNYPETFALQVWVRKCWWASHLPERKQKAKQSSLTAFMSSPLPERRESMALNVHQGDVDRRSCSTGRKVPKPGRSYRQGPFQTVMDFKPKKELQIREVSCMPLNLWKFGLRSSSELNSAGSKQLSIRVSCCSPQPTLIRRINRLKAGHFLGPGLHTPTAIFTAVLQLCDDDYSPFHRGSNYEFCCS